MEKLFWNDLQDRLDEVKQKPLPYKKQLPEMAWSALRKSTTLDFDQSVSTGISEDELQQVFASLMKLPENFGPLKKVHLEMLDRAAGELLPYGSLLHQRKNVRISGQDVQRGTFSHRHAVVYDEVHNHIHNRLSLIDPGQGSFRIYNSL